MNFIEIHSGTERDPITPQSVSLNDRSRALLAWDEDPHFVGLVIGTGVAYDLCDCQMSDGDIMSVADAVEFHDERLSQPGRLGDGYNEGVCAALACRRIRNDRHEASR